MSQQSNTGRQSLLKVNHYTMPPTPPDPSVPLRGRPPKRSKPMEYVPTGIRSQCSPSFIMKLFDRSVDLARFEADCPLYPVCRAWMRNQPRARINLQPACVNPAPRRDSMREDTVDRYRRGEINEIISMPKQNENDLKPFVLEKAFPEGEASFQLDKCKTPLEGNQLLQQHKKRWTDIRRRWQSHRCEYLKRNQLSYDLLDAIAMKQGRN
ncbi:protein lin-37 homolog [Wyeomyia smithii]|uniref:protein lin-37 homolog n=1 Tax=Wyeomyia smithii TaxID=174621 RepID=UPI002467C058|nr:protein lin-37 homolog [Wyeomyia smithii]